MPILNYTTGIDSNKTVGEIITILARAKANKVSPSYENGQPIALEFSITFHNQPIYFRLPCNIDGVFNALCKAKVPPKYRTKDQARRVAWRIIKDWVEAQIAIVEAEQASMTEVFLPYAIDDKGETFFQAFSESKVKQLN